MKKIGVITDSGANLEEQILKQYPNLKVLPLIINIKEVSYRDQVEITTEQVYQKLDQERITTSLPILSDLENALEYFKTAQFDEVLIINISSGLSGTFNAISLFIQDYQGLKISHYDCKTLAGAQGLLVIRALDLINSGHQVSQIIEELDSIRYHHLEAYFTVNTLKYLTRGGRIGKVEGTIGDILQIKPVIAVTDEGIYYTLNKAFGFKRALIFIKEKLVNVFKDKKIDVMVHYGNNEQEAHSFASKLQALLNIAKLIISPLTPVLGIHTGPAMIAVIATPSLA